MKAEQSFVMHETLKWIKQRAEKKKKDKNFLKNFRLQESALMIKEKLEKQSNAEESTKLIEQRFNDAEKRISLIEKEDRLTIHEKLEFHVLLQQATGAQISTEAPGEKDLYEWVKWKAWKVHSDKSKEEAQLAYITKVQRKVYEEESHEEREQRFNDAKQRISLEEIQNMESTRLTQDEKLDFYGLLQQATGATISTEAPTDYVE